MIANCKLVLVLTAAAALSGCANNARLRAEIGEIESRLGAVEGDIAQGTAAIGGAGKDIRTHVGYRPFQAWAANFGTKTATFRQTDRSGDLARENPTCRFVAGIPPHWDKDPGYRVWIHEDKSTKVDLTLGPLEFIPTNQGFQVTSPVDLWTKTQIAGAGRAPCVGGWSPTITAGAEGRARPKAVFQLGLSQPAGLQPRYTLDLVSPTNLDVEFRTGMQLPFFGDVDVKRTFTVENFARQLATGEFNLLINHQGEIAVPGGETRVYYLKTVDPAIRTDATGVTLESDIDLQRD